MCLSSSSLRIASAQIPAHFFPPLVASSAPLGVICPRLAERWGLTPALTIHAAVGDHPASVYATAPPEHQLTVSIGTSSQISRVAFTDAHEATRTGPAHPAVLQSHLPSPPSSVERRPYICPFNQRTLLLCASLNGGNVLQTFVEGLERATRELSADDGVPSSASVDDDDDNDRRKRAVQRMFARLIREATALHQQQTTSTEDSVLPICDARFFGERSTPDARGSLSHLSFPLLSPSQPLGGTGALFLSLCQGVITNLRNLIVDSGAVGLSDVVHPMLRDMRTVRCVGAAMQRNPLLPKFVAQVFGVSSSDVVVASSESQQGDADAAHGAALLALDWATINSKLWQQQQQVELASTLDR